MLNESGFFLHEVRVRPSESVIVTPDGEAHVSPRAMDVLLYLARRAGEVVSREEFDEAVWNSVVVSDDALTRCVSELRRVLGDTAGAPRFIKTIPKRGYQLVAPVEPSERPSGQAELPIAGLAQDRASRIRIFAILAVLTVALVLTVLLVRSIDESAARKPSIAVLAFDDLSAQGDQSYFADGISEEILNALAQIPELKVVGRNSAFSFKGQHHDLRDLGRALGVDHVLEGSVRRQDDRVRITAQLITVDDGFHLWSDTYDRQLDDIFAIQEDIARSVAAKLPGLLGFEMRPREFQRVEPAAYDLYLRARTQESQRTPEDLVRAADLFQAATLIQPDFSAARAGRARTLSVLWRYAPELFDSHHENAVRDEIRRALESDPDNAEALSTLAYVTAVLDRNFERALILNERAIELAPNDAVIANFAGDLFRFVGDFERMLEWERRARDLDPLHAFQVSDLALAHYVVQDFELALHWAEQALEIDAKSIAALNIASKSAMRLGDFARAREILAALIDTGGANALYSTAEIDAAEYGPDQTHDSYQQLLATVADGRYWKFVSVARIASLYGDHDRAAELLNFALGMGEPIVTFPYRFLPEHWPDHQGIQTVLAHPDLTPMWDVRRKHLPDDIDPIR